MSCDASTGYCYRAEVYRGKIASDRKDMRVGPNAVLRNMEHVLRGATKRLIVTDRFYSSVLLSTILLERQLYHVGTIRTDSRGFCKDLIYPKGRRKANVQRGVYRIAKARDYPNMVTAAWMDNQPVYFIATGCSTAPTTVGRRVRSTIVQTPAPQLIKDYNEWMGGERCGSSRPAPPSTLFDPNGGETEKVLPRHFSGVGRYGPREHVLAVQGAAHKSFS